MRDRIRLTAVLTVMAILLTSKFGYSFILVIPAHLRILMYIMAG